MAITPLRGRLSEFCKDDFAQLATKGWMIANVTNKKRASELINMLVQDLHTLYPKVDPKEIGSWTDIPTEKAFFDYYGSGLWPSAWECRMETLPLWEKLYKTSNIITCCDAWSVALPEYQNKIVNDKDKNGIELWLHKDQRLSNKNAADSIQGCFILTDIGKADYSTIILEPHKVDIQTLTDMFYDKFAYKEKHSKDKEHRVFTQEERQWLNQRCQRIKVSAKAGQLILWLSAVPHCAGCNILPENQSEYNIRIASYVAMVPKSSLCSKELKERRKLFAQEKSHLHSSCHNPIVQGNKPGALMPRMKSFYPPGIARCKKSNLPIVHGYEKATTGRLREYAKLLGF